MTQEPPRTISIPVPAALHTSIGILMALVAATAFWAHVEFPTDHHYKETAAVIALLTGFTALTYWLWCGQRCTRSATKDVGDAIAAAERKAAEREDRLLAALQEISEGVTENRGTIKEVIDAVDQATGAVEALQDAYMEEGKPPGTRDFD